MDLRALALATSAWLDARRRLMSEVSDPAEAASTRPPSLSSGRTAVARATGPTSRARPTAPPMIARLTVLRGVASPGLGGCSVRSDIRGVSFGRGARRNFGGMWESNQGRPSACRPMRLVKGVCHYRNDFATSDGGSGRLRPPAAALPAHVPDRVTVDREPPCVHRSWEKLRADRAPGRHLTVRQTVCDHRPGPQ